MKNHNIETSYETQKMRPGRHRRCPPGPFRLHMKRTLETIHEQNHILEMTRIHVHEITRIFDMKCTDDTPAAWSAPKAPTVWMTHETYT